MSQAQKANCTKLALTVTFSKVNGVMPVWFSLTCSAILIRHTKSLTTPP
jgi:hypothetical protein